MTRMALATMVWSRAARNIPIISPMRIVTISLWGRAVGRRRGPWAALLSFRTCQFSLGGVEGQDRQRSAPRARRCAVEGVAEGAQLAG